MDWASISPRESLSRLKRGAKAVDVRSPLEFGRGAIPGFANISILHDEHRHQVGLTYKNSGQEEAIALGHRLVEPLRPALLEKWQSVLRPAHEEDRLLICWRGGLRSKISAEWLSESGLRGRRVTGGYKALRAELLAQLEAPPPFFVLGGMTGSGKTELLRQWPASEVLDLEGLANHRGSSFGLKMKTSQPAQQTFENAIALNFFDSSGPRLVEAESRMIGACMIPDVLKAAMDASPLILLESSSEERVARVFEEYVAEPLRQAPAAEVRDFLTAALDRIQKRLGGLRHQAIRRELAVAFGRGEPRLEHHATWIESLLTEYYDPLYEHSLAAHGRTVEFRGDRRAVMEYLSHCFDRRRA